MEWARKYHHRTGDRKQRGKNPQRVGIEHRPKIVEKKQKIGDWESDTFIGKGHHGVLLSIVNRKSKFTLIGHCRSKEAREVTAVTLRLMEPFKALTHTVTSDNGKEYAYHQRIAQTLEAGFYFANPYHSWERGLNEHTNGLIAVSPQRSGATQCQQERIDLHSK